MPDPFCSPKRTLERAKCHFRDFEARITAFSNEKKWSYECERDLKGRNNRHKIKFDRAFFDEVPSIVFDLVNNMRAVLDQCGYAAAKAAGKSRLKQTAFPFGKDPDDLCNTIKRNVCADVPTEIVTLFRSFKPYKRGNPPLWHLNALCNTKKHAILAPAALESVQIRIGGAIIFIGSPKWGAEDHEMELVGMGGADFSDLDDAGSFTFRVIFDHVETWIRGSEPLAIVGSMGGEVERILLATEAKCRLLWPEAF